VVNDLVRVLAVQAVIGLQGIGEQFQTGRDVLYNLLLKVTLLARRDNRRMDPARVAIQQSEHNRLAHRPTSVDSLGALASVHVAGFRCWIALAA
jgi:hypothetical protein